MQGQNPGDLVDYQAAEKYIEERKDGAFRWGTRCLRGGGFNYRPCVLDRTGWENFYLSLPYDYDIRNDPVFDLSKSSYKRLGDLGFKWPEPTSREAGRIGSCGPDANSLTRPSRIGFPKRDQRPEPAYRTHLTDRTSLHHLRADPLEGVLPYGRQYDMSCTESVMHNDYKWRCACCATPPSCRGPTYETRVNRFMKTDLHKNNLIDKVVKFDDDYDNEEFRNAPLLKLKKAYNWPVNPITREPLGGRLLYYNVDPCTKSRSDVWPCGENKITECEPKVIPDQRCELLAHGPKKPKDSNNVNWNYNASALDMRFPTPNWECWEEVPEGCRCCPCSCRDSKQCCCNSQQTSTNTC